MQRAARQVLPLHRPEQSTPAICCLRARTLSRLLIDRKGELRLHEAFDGTAGNHTYTLHAQQTQHSKFREESNKNGWTYKAGTQGSGQAPVAHQDRLGF